MSLLEQVQAYWDRQPCAIRHSPKMVGTPEYFAQVTERKYHVQPHVRDFADFPKWKEKKVLEIGCGIGTDAEQFAREGADYTGVDLSPASIAVAAGRFATLGLQGRFYAGNAESIADVVPVEHYDLVYAFGVLHHTPAPEAVLARLAPYMDAESELRVMVYAEHSWKAAMIDAGLDQSEAQANCPLACRYTEEQARELLKDYEIVRLWQDHIFPYQVKPYKKWRYEVEPWFAQMPPEMFRALEARLGWHMLIWAKPKPAAGPQPTEEVRPDAGPQPESPQPEEDS